MIVVLCGMDGSGKTTLAKKLVDDLLSCEVAATMVHGHEYAISSDSFGLEETKIKKYGWLLKLLLPLAYADNIYTYFTRYRPRAKAGVLVLDRYFYDKVARMMYFGICGKTLAKLYVKMLPRPEKVFFLDAPEEVARRRNEEYTIEQFRRFREAYLYLANILNVELIDTSRPLEQCRAMILESVKSHEEGKR